MCWCIWETSKLTLLVGPTSAAAIGPGNKVSFKPNPTRVTVTTCRDASVPLGLELCQRT